MLGREVQGHGWRHHSLVSPSTVASAIVLEAVFERFPLLALICSEVSSFFSAVITPDAVVAIGCALIAQARIENASLISLIESQIAPQFITVMFAGAHNLPVRPRVSSAVSRCPSWRAMATLRLGRNAHSEQECYTYRERTQSLLECTDFHTEPPPNVCEFPVYSGIFVLSCLIAALALKKGSQFLFRMIRLLVWKLSGELFNGEQPAKIL
jgi:hypothetical protein